MLGEARTMAQEIGDKLALTPPWAARIAGPEIGEHGKDDAEQDEIGQVAVLPDDLTEVYVDVNDEVDDAGLGVAFGEDLGVGAVELLDVDMDPIRQIDEKLLGKIDESKLARQRRILRLRP